MTFSARTLAWTFVPILGACVEHPDFLESQKVRTWENRCDGEAPLCLDACGTTPPIGEAVCGESAWTCPRGIRDDLCCDPVARPGTCETWSASCSTSEPCPGGYTCVHSRTHPVPADAGVCRLGELDIPPALTQCDDAQLTPPALLEQLDLSPIKVNGVVNVVMTCEDRRCDAENPCCRACAGAYMIELVDEAHAERVTLPLRTESIACTGTNCGYTCAPLQPGRRYTVWGMFAPDTSAIAPGTLYYGGHCVP
ncbi:MAG: hypothetical protein EP329_17240 [Deltaproteobacteria bacterium]|nr:MAG: hypothetical protein EP329_17240 [Deltaproteobacteria bacterium]